MEVSSDPAKQLITSRFSAPCHQLVMVEAAYIPLHYLGDLCLPILYAKLKKTGKPVSTALSSVGTCYKERLLSMGSHAFWKTGECTAC